MSNYFEHPELSELYLEDSFVLDLQISPNTVVLDMEFVLREGHQRYSMPTEDEQYCYNRGRLRFTGVTTSTWRMPTRLPATDETGEVDYGGIESYSITENRHHLSGEFGELLITCAQLVVEFEPYDA